MEQDTGGKANDYRLLCRWELPGQALSFIKRSGFASSSGERKKRGCTAYNNWSKDAATFKGNESSLLGIMRSRVL